MKKKNVEVLEQRRLVEAVKNCGEHVQEEVLKEYKKLI